MLRSCYSEVLRVLKLVAVVEQGVSSAQVVPSVRNVALVKLDLVVLVEVQSSISGVPGSCSRTLWINIISFITDRVRSTTEGYVFTGV